MSGLFVLLSWKVTEQFTLGKDRKVTHAKRSNIPNLYSQYGGNFLHGRV